MRKGADKPQADSEIKEGNLLNFVVNSLGEELAINLGEDVEVTTEKLYEVLASAGGTPINHVCETTGDSPHAALLNPQKAAGFTV